MMDVQITIDSDVCVSSSPEFCCHCCYDILIDPTTLTCGHSFCRHCLALWWSSSGRLECPECRQSWGGLPKVNILLRDAVEKMFPDDVNRRRSDVRGDPRIRQVLHTFHEFGEKQKHHAHALLHQLQQREFNSRVIAALGCVSVLLSMYLWSSIDQHLLVSKPISRWTVDDVTLWVEQLGDWTKQYRETFRQEQISGRLLSFMRDEDLSSDPFRIQDSLHRRAFLLEIQNLEVKAPENLWDYKALNLGKSLFLLIGLRDSPRLTLLYLYLFDYDETFLPFINTSWFSHTASMIQDGPSNKTLHDWQSWRQWVGLLAMHSLLPYQLLADYAWGWLNIHYWTSRVIILNAYLLSLLEICFIWRLCRRGEIMILPNRLWLHWKKLMLQWFVFVLLWPLIPQFLCNFVFYEGLYLNPIYNIVILSKILINSDIGHLNI